MFKYTIATFGKIVEDFKRCVSFFKNVSLFFTSVYFIYALINKTGNFYANIVLATLFVAYTIFEIATRGKNMKSTRKTVKKGYKWTKILIKAFTVGAMLYGFYTATAQATPISIILATLMVILWVLQLLFLIICNVIESKYELFKVAIKEDVKRLKPFGKKDDEEKPKEIVMLDEQIERVEKEKQEKRAQKREEKRTQKREKRAERKEKIKKAFTKKSKKKDNVQANTEN